MNKNASNAMGVREMKTFSLATVLVIAGLSFSGAATAQETVIECPTQSILTDVTTKLPDGWSSTQQGGKLFETRVQSVGGQPRLVCAYKMSSTTVAVMRAAPSGMGCRASNRRFVCKPGVLQGAGNAGESKSIDVKGQARHDVDVKEQQGKTLTPGNVRDMTTPAVHTKGGCPDLTLTGVNVNMLSRDPQGQYSFRLAARVKNRGDLDYLGANGQQYVEIHTISPGSSPRRLGQTAFRAIPAGGDDVQATYDVLRWRTGQEFPPSYRFTIVYGPDASADKSRANDDCAMTNNSTTITGDDINSIIRGSGI
jgi:hypothetical protein